MNTKMRMLVGFDPSLTVGETFDILSDPDGGTLMFRPGREFRIVEVIPAHVSESDTEAFAHVLYEPVLRVVAGA